MGELQAHVLLHPVRMRVVLVLGTDDLTTKQIHERLPDVAQASLYRAVARLVDVGILTVVERHRRGGAIERVYRIASRPEFGAASGTPEEFVAAADTLARALLLDAAQHVATGAWEPDDTVLLRESVHLTSDEYLRVRERFLEFGSTLKAAEPGPSSEVFSVTVAVIPQAGVAHDGVSSPAAD